MLFSFTSRIVSALAAFLYPGYASYKTLSQRPASEPELERWLMYWSVLGCIVGVEYLAEWLISWIPLYTTFKAIFLLYLALPQTQGATYIYTVHLRPFFATHEQQIDAAIAEIRGRAYRFVQEKARALWAAVLGALAPGAAGAAQQDFTPGAPAARAPSMVTPDQGPAQLLSSLWTAYGPGIVAGGATLLRQGAAATTGMGAWGARRRRVVVGARRTGGGSSRRSSRRCRRTSRRRPCPCPPRTTPRARIRRVTRQARRCRRSESARYRASSRRSKGAMWRGTKWTKISSAGLLRMRARGRARALGGSRAGARAVRAGRTKGRMRGSRAN
ncbi:TB2/DP1, HVA22 family-domain-containing protein, partial [Pholiota molesta]